jgi:hypothetical protein
MLATGYDRSSVHSLGAGGYLAVFTPARRPTPAQIRASVADRAFCDAAAASPVDGAGAPR